MEDVLIDAGRGMSRVRDAHTPTHARDPPRREEADWERRRSRSPSPRAASQAVMENGP